MVKYIKPCIMFIFTLLALVACFIYAAEGDWQPVLAGMAFICGFLYWITFI